MGAGSPWPKHCNQRGVVPSDCPEGGVQSSWQKDDCTSILFLWNEGSWFRGNLQIASSFLIDKPRAPLHNTRKTHLPPFLVKLESRFETALTPKLSSVLMFIDLGLPSSCSLVQRFCTWQIVFWTGLLMIAFTLQEFFVCAIQPALMARLVHFLLLARSKR